MFKKAVEGKALQRLSGADKKKLRRTAKDRFPNATDQDLDAILPPKADISVSKYPNRSLVYAIEGGFPMLFDLDGRGSQLYPTVYALWTVPHLLPSFLLKAPEVSHYILSGADLMFPGIAIPQDGLPHFREGQPYSVLVPGNPAPIAVGTTTMSTSEAMQAGLRGKALRIFHYYPDFLWGSVEAPYVPNAGFLQDVVLGDPALNQPPADESTEIGEESAQEEKELPSNADQMTSVIAEEMTADVNTMLKISETTTQDDNNEEEGDKEDHVMTVDQIDALLDKCLLQALHTTLKDKDFPILGSILWSHHILPCRPSGTSLDIKKSSHKKLSKWLLSKSSAGLISAKEDKYTKEVRISKVNRGHADYMSFRPEKKTKDPVAVDQKDNINTASSTDAHAEKSLLEVVEVYKATTHVNPIFVAVGADTTRYYTASEASDVVFSYVEKENLVKPTDKSVVILDAILCDALYKGTIKKGGAYPSEIHKRDITPTFVGRMQIHHHVRRGGSDSVVRKGGIKCIQIMTERRQGNKKMTRVSGLESFLLDAESLASELQKKFACSTTTAELPGKKGYEVLVQGGVIDHLARHLVDHYGIPKRYIEVLDKTKR